MSIVTDNQREKELQSKLDGLLSRTSVIHREVLEATNELTIEVNRWRNVAKSATLNAEKMEADYEAVLDCRDARFKEMEQAYNDAIDDSYDLHLKLHDVTIVAWGCAALAAAATISMILGAYL